MKRTLVLTLLSSTLLMSGCGALGLATGAGAVVGMTATKEGGLKGGVNDLNIKAQINDLWFKKNTEMFRKLSITVDQGRVLLTGVVQNPEDRVEAVRLAWQPKGVKQVINEIRVGESGGVKSFAQDEWIGAQLRTKLIANQGVQSANYNIEVVQGSIYLMGVAQNQYELDRVIRISQGIKGVKEVVSYVKLAGEPISSTGAATTVPGNYSAQQSSSSSSSYSDSSSTSYQQPSGSYVNDPSVTTYPVMPASPPPAGIQSEVLPP